jgi:hypothetical protein
VRLIKYADDDGSELADVPIEPSARSDRLFWSYDRVFPEHAGHLSISLKGVPSPGAPDGYEVIVGPFELGVMVGSMGPQEVERFIRGFLARATPEIVGAVVGRLAAHFAQAIAERPG